MQERIKSNPLMTKKHLTKKEIAEREQGIIKPKSYTIPAQPPPYFNKQQKSKWREMRRMYVSAECSQLFCFTDAHALEIYCVTYCEAQDLIKQKEEMAKELERAFPDPEDRQKLISLKIEYNRKWQLDYSRLMTLLTKLQREMFLTPLSRVKAGSMQKFYDGEDGPKDPTEDFDL